MDLQNNDLLELSLPPAPFTTFVDGDTAMIIVNDEVTVENAREVTDFIYGLGFEPFTNTVKNIKLLLNSPGGSVFGGLDVYSALKASNKNIFTSIQGICASICAVLFLSAPIENREMVDYGLWMIHDASGGDEKTLAKIKESLMTILGQAITDNLFDLMSEETWFNKTEMIANGIITNGDTKTDSSMMNKIEELFAFTNLQLTNKYKQFMALDKETLKNATPPPVKEEDADKKEETTTVPAPDTDEPKKEDDVQDAEVPVEEQEEEKEESEEMAALRQELEEAKQALASAQNAEQESEEMEKMKAELEETKKALTKYKNSIDVEDKVALLNKAGVSPKFHNTWLKYSSDEIKELTKTVNRKTPKVEYAAKNVQNLSELSNDEKIELMSNDPVLYASLFHKHK